MPIPIPDNLPLWIVVTLLMLNLFREPIASFLFDKFPAMTTDHFSSIAKDATDRREFEQQKELELLRAKLGAAEAERKQQVERERTYTAIIDNQFQFMQKMIDTGLIELEASIVSEIKSLRQIIERLNRQVRGEADTPAQEKLLKRLEGGK